MTYKDVKIAYWCELPVMFDGVEYERISAIINRKPKGEMPFIQIELLQKGGRGVVIAAPDRCTRQSAGEEHTERLLNSIIERNENNVTNYDPFETNYKKE